VTLTGCCEELGELVRGVPSVGVLTTLEGDSHPSGRGWFLDGAFLHKGRGLRRCTEVWALQHHGKNLVCGQTVRYTDYIEI